MPPNFLHPQSLSRKFRARCPKNLHFVHQLQVFLKDYGASRIRLLSTSQYTSFQIVRHPPCIFDRWKVRAAHQKHKHKHIPGCEENGECITTRVCTRRLCIRNLRTNQTVCGTIHPRNLRFSVHLHFCAGCESHLQTGSSKFA